MTARTDVTKRRLYKAAIELFSASGIEETSVEEIVDRAGVAKATMYYHFPSKSELADAAITYYTHRLTDCFDSVFADCAEDPLECLQQLVAELLAFFSEEQAFSRVMTREMWSTDLPWHATLAEMRNRLVRTLAEVIESGITKKVFRPNLEPGFAGYAVFGMTTFAALDHLVNEPDRPFEDMLRQTQAVIAQSFNRERVP
jgi:AcrR family transcriptional regulator